MKTAKILLVVVVTLFVGLNAVAYRQAGILTNNPPEERPPLDRTPADVGLEYRDVKVTTSDGLELSGWYIPSRNSALILLQNGYKMIRTGHLDDAQMISRTGYGVLFTTVRAHDVNPGRKITFGIEEMKDIDAWVRFALELPGIDAEKIGMVGDSLGGSMAIQYASGHKEIKAVVAHSAFSSMQDTIDASVRHFTGLPPFPFAPLIKFWAELDLGISIDSIDAKKWIANISPRPVMIIHSLDDDVISPESGELLFEAAHEPKELWLESGVGHADFDTEMPEEYERRVVGFFDRWFFNHDHDDNGTDASGSSL